MMEKEMLRQRRQFLLWRSVLVCTNWEVRSRLHELQFLLWGSSMSVLVYKSWGSKVLVVPQQSPTRRSTGIIDQSISQALTGMDSGRLQAKYVSFQASRHCWMITLPLVDLGGRTSCMILNEGYLYGPSYYRGCQPGFVGVEKHGFTMVAIVWIDNGLHGRSISMQ